MSNSAKGWGLMRLSVVPTLGFSYLAANFGLIYAIPTGIILVGLTLLLFERWGLPKSPSLISAYVMASLASWGLIYVMAHTQSYPGTFVLFWGGLTYAALWQIVGWFGGIYSNQDSELRELLDDPNNVSARERVATAKAGQERSEQRTSQQVETSQ